MGQKELPGEDGKRTAKERSKGKEQRKRAREQEERNKRHRREQVLCPCFPLLAVCPKSFSLLSSSALLSSSLHSSHSLLQCTLHVYCKLLLSFTLTFIFPFILQVTSMSASAIC